MDKPISDYDSEMNARKEAVDYERERARELREYVDSLPYEIPCVDDPDDHEFAFDDESSLADQEYWQDQID